MKIDLDPGTGTYRLDDAGVFTAFSVVLPSPRSLPLGHGDVPAHLGWASPDGQHVFVRVQTLVELAGDRVTDEGWRAGLDGMVAYATKSGWTSPDGTAVRAHCTTSEDTGPTG